MSLQYNSNCKEQSVITSCSYDCGARCLLKVYRAGGKITRIETDRQRPGLTACIRGLSQKEVVYASDRLTQPLKRIGKRGSGEFEPISWEEAFDTIALQLSAAKEQYGAESILLMDHSGSLSALHGTRKTGQRFFFLVWRMYRDLGQRFDGGRSLSLACDLWH